MYSTFVDKMLRKYYIRYYEITTRDSVRNYIMDTLKFRLVTIMVRGYLTFGVSFSSFSDNSDHSGHIIAEIEKDRNPNEPLR